MLHFVAATREQGTTRTSMPLHCSSTAIDAANCDMNAFVAPYNSEGVRDVGRPSGKCILFLVLDHERGEVVRDGHGGGGVALHVHQCLPRGWESKKPVTMKPALLKTN